MGSAVLDLTKALQEAESLIAEVCICGHMTSEHTFVDSSRREGYGAGPCAADRHCHCDRFQRAPLKVVPR
jgi:hypothetical protein